MIKVYTCIVCPNGCEIEVDLDGETINKIDGASCKKGKEYVAQELTNPQRNIATSVKVIDGEKETVSVRLNGTIPKSSIFDIMNEIKTMEVEAPIKIGDILKSNILNLNVDIVATRNIDRVNN